MRFVNYWEIGDKANPPIEVERIGRMYSVQQCNVAGATQYECMNLSEVHDAVEEILGKSLTYDML